MTFADLRYQFECAVCQTFPDDWNKQRELLHQWDTFHKYWAQSVDWFTTNAPHHLSAKKAWDIHESVRTYQVTVKQEQNRRARERYHKRKLKDIAAERNASSP